MVDPSNAKPGAAGCSEVKLGAGILKLVRADLRELEEICSGEKRQTNHHR